MSFFSWRTGFLIAAVTVVTLTSCSHVQAGESQSSSVGKAVDLEAVLQRHVAQLNSTEPSNATDIAEVSLNSVLETVQYLFASPTSLNESFHLAPEIEYDAFWEVVNTARLLAGLDANATASTAGDTVSLLDSLTTQVAQLPNHLCWPVLRRFIAASLLQRRRSQGQPFNAEAQTAVVRLFTRLFALHRQAAGRKGVIDFFHVSKAGGTTFCQLAKLNGCRTQSFAARRNCLIREFDDVPRWVNNSLHVSLAPEGLRTPWFANWGAKARNTVSCRIRKRFMLRRRFNILANEFTVYGASRFARNAHVCPGHLNVLQLRHPQTRLRSHLMWVWALYDHHFKEQASAFFPTHGSAHWHALMPAVTHNYYIRSLLGESVYYLPEENITQSHLAAARLAMTQFDVVVLLEQPDMSQLLYEMAIGWGLGFGDVHARTSGQVQQVGRQGLPEPEDWGSMLLRNQLDLELYRYGSLLTLLDSIVFDVAREAGLGSGYATVGEGGAGLAGVAVAGSRAVAPGDDEQWELQGNATRRGGCGFVSAHDWDGVLPPWLVV